MSEQKDMLPCQQARPLPRLSIGEFRPSEFATDKKVPAEVLHALCSMSFLYFSQHLRMEKS